MIWAVVITGVSPSGIGSATAIAVASQGPATLVLASRTRSKVEEVASGIKEKYPNVPVKAVILDLSSLDSVRQAAAEISDGLDHVDVLINNAGISLQTRDPVVTANGTTVDLQLYTNHVGPFLFTELLLPRLLSAGASATKGGPRIVNLSSHGHRLSPIRFSDFALEKELYEGVPEAERPPVGANPAFLQTKDGFPGFVAYGQSKAANILHAVELTKRLAVKQANVFAVSVHPGTIDTGLMRSLDDTGKQTMVGTAPGGVCKTFDQGAATTLVAAFDPLLSALVSEREDKCLYLADCQVANDKMGAHAADAVAAEKLWRETEGMLGIHSVL